MDLTVLAKKISSYRSPKVNRRFLFLIGNSWPNKFLISNLWIRSLNKFNPEKEERDLANDV